MSTSKDMGLSPAQSAAVTDPRPEVLVTAAAGSGKTRLLVAAVVRALLDEELPVERLVAVTFTRKAGAELAARIREALEACGRTDLAQSLDAASVGTIHSLCRRLVKDQALKAGVDPACAVLEAEAARLVKMEALERAWEETVQRADGVELEALAAQGASLGRDVVELYDRLRGLGQQEPSVDIPAGPDAERTRQRLTGVVEEALTAGLGRPKPSDSLLGDLAKLRECLEWLEGPAGERVGETGLRMSEEFFPSRRAPGDLKEAFAMVRSILTEYRCTLAEAQLGPLARATDVLLAEFHRCYASAKTEHGLMDFADLELRGRGLLTGSPEDGRGEATREGGGPGVSRDCFLLVDEFQDTNELQCTILSGLGAERVLMVGDERQSIYRFRGADVEVFRRRQAELGAGEDGSPSGGVHRLDVNYRSSVSVLEFINTLFSAPGFFGEEYAPLEPDPERQPIRPEGGMVRGGGAAGGERAASSVAAAEVLVAERRVGSGGDERVMSAREAEARVLATRVRQLVEQEGWRQRDIVILLPTQIEVETYREALLAQAMEVYVVRGKGYYSREEVTDVLALMRILLTPHDDLALLTVLRSPLVGLSDDALYLLGRERRTRRAGSLWEVVRGDEVGALEYSDLEALRVFRDRVEQLRTQVGRPGLARHIDEAISLFAYDLCVLGAPDGVRRFANVRKLMRLADEFESSTGPDLGGFLSAIRGLGEISDQEGTAPTLGEGEDVVRVMTIHQAKGLEFPVVVLAGLGMDGHRTSTSTFAVGHDGRMGMFLKGHRNRTYEEADPHWGPAAEITQEEARRESREDIRLLYVAMTRAQEQLVLVGARPLKGKLDGTRIGRILGALGLAEYPESGEELAVQGLAAVVTGVESAATGGEPAAPPREGGSSRGASESEKGAPSGATPLSILETVERVGAPERVSFSSLAAYERCPRQFYLERVLGLSMGEGAGGEGAEEADLLDGSVLDPGDAYAGREVGVLVHHLLERFTPAEEPPADEILRAAVDEALSATATELPDAEKQRAVRLTQAAWGSPVAERLGLTEAEREVPFFFSAGGMVVNGIMDLVLREAECWLVTDYKTNALQKRSLAEVAEAYTLQCAVYGLAALRAGAPAVQMELLFLERPEDPVSVRYEAEDISNLESVFTQAVGGLQQGVFPRNVGDECGLCLVAAVCRAMVAD